ncbi:MAG: hypothetical protein JSV91_08460 [Phycisphaerales bacterium]|nr:MAG: hypothetical protein JSV91_08460 [Phycisphaerales bacterium]
MKLRKTTSAAMILTLAAFGLTGCGNGESTSPEAAEDTLPETDVTLPTEEEADAEADAAIGEENADDVFNELTEEIDKELEEDG